MLSILILPLFSTIITGLFGRYLGSNKIYQLSTITLFNSWVLTTWCITKIIFKGQTFTINLIQWLDTSIINLNFTFSFDLVSCLMLWLITFISGLVHFYTIEYTYEDPFIVRFYLWLQAFTCSMLWLVTSNNLITLFICWELIGLFSFLLISFWFTRIEAAKAGLLAMVINRIGDLSLSLGIFIIYLIYNTFNFSILNSLILESIDYYILEWCCFFLLIGSLAKSAQWPLHLWLRSSMNGPTPVSSLIHTSTLVTAGIFLLIKLSGVIQLTISVVNLSLIIGTITTILAGTMALVSKDIKEIIANSTISQLAYLLIACGLSQYSASLFHLLIHGCFKACLFLAAGIIIHAIKDEQDIRLGSQLALNLPFTLTVFIIASLSLAGFPFSSGFYSKDLIIELSSLNYHNNRYAFILSWLGVILTSFYSFRALNLVFYSTPSSNFKIKKEATEPNINMLVPIFLLCLASIYAGFFLKEILASSGTLVWNLSLDDYTSSIITTGYLNRTTILEAEFTDASTKLLVLIASLITIITITFLYSNSKVKWSLSICFIFKKVYLFLNNRWWLEQLSYNIIGNLVMYIGHHITFKLIDRIYLENKQFWLPMYWKNTIPNQIFSFTLNVAIILLILIIW